MGLKILVVGSGGREHTLVWKIAQSKKVKKIYCAPGNAGIASLAELVPLKVEDLDGIVNFCREKAIDLVVVGPELPLTLGLVDALQKVGIKAFGPSQQAAELEGSKVFAKNLMHNYGIPTAEYHIFTEAAMAKTYLRQSQGPWVVKADGLAAGKGVLICTSLEEAEKAVETIMIAQVFGQAGKRIIIEEYLEGEEVTILALCDGETVIPLASSQDHKRVFDDDQGPNTGGMGAYSPAPVATEELKNEVFAKILQPTIRAMQAEGRSFKGVLYAGLMITAQGPRVLEYNVRFGDPETQAVLPRLKNDLVDLLLAVCDGSLAVWENKIKWSNKACVAVVMASAGYPGDYERGHVIEGLEKLDKETIVFQAGTTVQNGKIVTTGGRVLAVTVLGDDLPQAAASVYQEIKKLKFKGAHYRKDIAQRAFRHFK